MTLFRRSITLLFFFSILCLGLWIVDDYGITYDEGVQRRHGLVSVEYVADKLGIAHKPLTDGNPGFAPYGVIYQIGAVAVELMMDADEDPYEYYRIRHVLSFLLFGVALVCFYRMLRLRWPERAWLPLIGTSVLLLSPRIFAHAFFNPKDHILLVFYVIATYTFFRYLKVRSGWALFVHILATALALNTRPAALIIPAGTVALLLAEQLILTPTDYRRLRHAAMYLPASLLLTLPFFPFLWQDTGARAVGAITTMANYTWSGEVLFFGKLIPAGSLPWYYIPAWISITTPVIYLLFMVIGLVWAARRTLPNLLSPTLYRDRNRAYDTIQLALAVCPIVVVIALQSTLYNGWRHLHFIYPSLVYLLMLAYARLSAWRPRITGIVLAVGMVMTLVTMVRMHPMQQVFFNQLVRGPYTLQNFEMDYWGSGYRAALSELAEEIPAGEVRSLKCMEWPCEDNIRALPPTIRDKFRVEEKWHLADYVVTHYGYPTEREAIPTRGEYFSDPAVELYPDGKLAIGIYRVNQ